MPSGASARAVVRAARAGGRARRRAARLAVRALGEARPPPAARGRVRLLGPLRPDEVLERVYRGEVRLHRFTVPEGLRGRRRSPRSSAAERPRERGRASSRAVHDPALARTLGLPFPSARGLPLPRHLQPSPAGSPRGNRRGDGRALQGGVREGGRAAQARGRPHMGRRRRSPPSWRRRPGGPRSGRGSRASSTTG